MRTLFIAFLILLSLKTFAQFTSTQAGNWDDCATWGTCPGTTIGVDYPGRTDDVSIGHAVTVDNTLDNSATNTQPNDEALAGVCGCTGVGTTGCGNNPTGCNSNSFYHQGNITMTNGGALTSSVRTTFQGDLEILNGGSIRVTSTTTLFLMGRVDVRAGGSLISNRDMVISGDAIVNAEALSTVGIGDDFYFDGDNAFVCGAGTIDLDDTFYPPGTRNNSVRHFNTSDGSTTDQICSNTTVTCADGDCCGGQCQADIDADGSDGEISPGDGSASSPEVLPVELLSFSWKENQGSISIHWSTATEINNSGFDLFRSTDGLEFHHLVFISGHGTTNEKVDYSYEDRTPLSGVNYYQLIQRDFDGVSEDLGIIRAFSSTVDVFSVYPNPATERAFIHLGNRFINTTTHLRIFKMSGELVLEKEEWIEKDDIEIDLSFSAGIYFIEVDNGIFKSRSKFLKSN